MVVLELSGAVTVCSIPESCHHGEVARFGVYTCVHMTTDHIWQPTVESETLHRNALSVCRQAM